MNAAAIDLGLLFAIPARPRTTRVVMPAEVDDAELVRRAQGGDRWAEEAIYRRHVGYVLGTATRLLGVRADAEDVAQETFAAALENLESLRDGSAVRAWLAQIAVRLAHRRFRRRRLARALGLDRHVDDASLEALAAPESSAEARSELAALDRVLATLPTAERIAWMLRRVEGWELADVAAACECSLATVKRRIAAAEAVVQKHVNLADGGAP